MNGLTKGLDWALTRVLITLMLCLVGAVLWQVISRYLFSSPSSWTEEMARFLLIWIALLGAVYAFRTGMHLGLDILPKKLEGASAQWLKRLTLFLVIAFSGAVLVVGGGSLVQLTWELRQHSAVLGLPMSLVYAVIPLSGILICFYAVAGFFLERIAESHDDVLSGE
jgi:TRAP-type C4-dicarboxylate transport system permease small subunit